MWSDRRRQMRAPVAITLAGLVLVACGEGPGGGESGTSLDDMDPVTLSYNTVGPSTGSTGEVVGALVDYVKDESDGKITIEPYYSSSLLSGEEALKGVGAGIADMTYLGVPYYPEDLPVATWYNDVAGLIPATDIPDGLLASSAAAASFYLGNEDVKQEMADHNIKVLAAHDGANGYYLQCNDPLSDVGALDGLRTRVGSKIWAAQAEELGMTPQFTQFAEIYESLQRDVVDCAIQGPPSVGVDSGWFEVAKHYSPTSFASMPGNIHVINLDVWEGLPDEAKQIVADGMLELQTTFLRNAVQGYADFAADAQDSGVILHDAKAINAELEKARGSLRDKLFEEAPDALSDPERVADQADKAVDEWKRRLSNDLGVTSRPKSLEAFRELDGFEIDSYAEALKADIYDQLLGIEGAAPEEE